jgi:hypothetical protein
MILILQIIVDEKKNMLASITTAAIMPICRVNKHADNNVADIIKSDRLLKLKNLDQKYKQKSDANKNSGSLHA